MFLVGYNYYHDRPAWTLERFSDYLDLPGEPVHRTLRVLVNAGYLIEIENEGVPVYLPLHDMEKIRLVDILTDVRASRETRALNLQQLVSVAAVDDIMSAVNAAHHEALGERSLKSLVQPVDEDLEAALRDLPVD
jgi:hypothetical protein